MKEKPGSIHSGHRLRSWEVQVVAGGRLRLLERGESEAVVTMVPSTAARGVVDGGDCAM